jgi:hypothetical protein
MPLATFAFVTFQIWPCAFARDCPLLAIVLSMPPVYLGLQAWASTPSCRIQSHSHSKGGNSKPMDENFRGYLRVLPTAVNIKR